MKVFPSEACILTGDVLQETSSKAHTTIDTLGLGDRVIDNRHLPHPQEFLYAVVRRDLDDCRLFSIASGC